MENIDILFWFVPAAAIVALAFAYSFYRNIKREREGSSCGRTIRKNRYCLTSAKKEETDTRKSVGCSRLRGLQIKTQFWY